MEIDYSNIESEAQLGNLRIALGQILDYLQHRAQANDSDSELIYLGSQPVSGVGDIVRAGFVELIDESGNLMVPGLEEVLGFTNALLINAVTRQKSLNPAESKYENKLMQAVADSDIPNFVFMDEATAKQIEGTGGGFGIQGLSADHPLQGQILLSLPGLLNITESVTEFRKGFIALENQLYWNLTLLNDPDSTAGWTNPKSFSWGPTGISFYQDSEFYSEKWKERFNHGGFMLYGYFGGEVYGADAEGSIDHLKLETARYHLSQVKVLKEMKQIQGPLKSRKLLDRYVVLPFRVDVRGMDKELAKKVRKLEFLDWKVLGQSLRGNNVKNHAFLSDDGKMVIMAPQFVDFDHDYSIVDVFGMLHMINPMLSPLLETSFRTGANPADLARDHLLAKRAGEPGVVPLDIWEQTVVYLDQLNEILNGFSRDNTPAIRALAVEMRTPAMKGLAKINEETRVLSINKGRGFRYGHR